MSKKSIVIVLAVLTGVLIIAAASYFYWDWYKKTSLLKALEENGDLTGKILEDATKGALPSIQTNPLENKPDINPVDAANPMKNIKTNPFE